MSNGKSSGHSSNPHDGAGITGTRGNDVLTGGDGNDRIDGRQGNDTLYGGGGNDLLKGGRGNDMLLGGPGNDWLKGKSGNDVLDGGAGSDRVEGNSGNDVLVYRASENIGAHDRYDGDSGCDTLRLELTRAEWMSAPVQADIARFLAFLDRSQSGGHRDGHHDDDDHHGSDRWFEFSAFNLDVKDIEKLEVRVDGVLLDPRDQAVDAVNDTAAVAEDSSVGGNVLANDSVPDLVRSVELLAGPAHGDLTFNPDGTYSYTPGAFFNSLAQGETASESLTYRVTDADGDSDTAVVAFTITGTNDGPVVAATDVAGAVNELVAPLGELTDSGTIAFSDVDLSDVHSVGAVTASAGALGTFSASVSTDTTGSGTGGAVTWNYSVAASAVEYLAAGQEKLETFSFDLSDGNGGTVTRTVSVTITGTNDEPVVAATDVAGAVTELVVPVGDLADSGTIAFSDVDLSDVHIVGAVTASAGALGTLSASVSTDTTGSGSGGEVTWNYSVAASAVEYLAAGEEKLEIFSFDLSDGNGGTATRTVNTTITGTNDAPVIVAEDLTGAVTENLGSSGATANVAVVYNGSTAGPSALVNQINDQTYFNSHAVLVRFDQVDTAAELSQFNVVIDAQSYFEAGSEQYYAALRDWVLADMGGVVTSDWFSYKMNGNNLSATMLANADAVTPIAANHLGWGYSDATVYSVDGSHAITTGVANLAATSGLYQWSGTQALDAVAVSLAGFTGNSNGFNGTWSGVAYTDVAGVGREVYLGGFFSDQIYRDADAGAGNADRLMEQAVNWVAGGGNGGSLTDSGAITFSDVDLTDAHVVSDTGTPVGAVLGSLTASLAADTTGTGIGGQLNWSYTVANSAVDYLSEGQTRVDSFTLTLDDQHGGVITRQIDVTITGTNDAPVANADTAVTDEDHSISISVLANDTDVDTNDTHSVDSAVVTSGLGTASAAGDQVAYDPGTAYQYLAAGESATVAIDYTMSDNHGGADASSVTLTVNGVNDRPVALDDEISGNFGGGTPSGPLSVAVVYQTLWSSISATVAQLNDDSWFDFDATAVHFTAADSAAELAQYDVILLGNSYFETFSADFWAALHQYVDTAEGGVVSNGYTNYSLAQVRGALGLTANADYDASTPITGDGFRDNINVLVPVAGGHPITDGLSSIQTSGVVASSNSIDAGAVSLATLFGSDSALAYQDQPGDGRTVYLGFHYTDLVYRDSNMAASVDGDRLLEQAVNWAGGNESGSGAATDEDTALTIDNAVLLANDTDPDLSDVLTISSVSASSVQGASVSIDVNGDVVYNPGAALQHLAKGEMLADSFTYTVSDGHGGSDTATVSLTVAGVNDAPVAEDGRTVQVAEGTADVPMGIAAPTDVDGDTLSVTLNSLPTNGTVALAGGAAVSAGQVISVADLAGLKFSAGSSAGDSDSALNYTVSDGMGGSDSASVAISTLDAGSAGGPQQVLGFEGQGFFISTGYGGFDWSSTGSYYNVNQDADLLSDGGPGSISAPNSAWNGWAGKTSSITLMSDETFNFDGAYFRDWSGANDVTLNGYHDGQLVASQFLDLNPNWQWFDSSISDIDVLQIVVTNGSFSGNGITGTGWWAMDNFTFSLGGGIADLSVTGGAGPDVLAGGAGNDTLTGGTGPDRFFFGAGDNGTDLITDFASGTGGDALDLRSLLTGYDPDTSDIDDFLLLTESSGNTTLSVDANGAVGGTSFEELATLQGVTGLTLGELQANDNLLI